MDISLPHAPSRVLIPVTLLVAVALVLVALAVQAPDAAAVDRGTIFKVGGDVAIPQADVAESVVAIGGNVNVAGTVKKSIVAVGGDVRLGSTAQVGTDMKSGDTSVTLVGGNLTKASGASLQGKTSTVAGSWAGDAWRTGITDRWTNPISGFSILGWIGSTILALLGAILIAALLPRQVSAVDERVRQRFWPSLGWGALGLIVIVPVVTILLVVTIIGLLAILPWLLVVVATVIMGWIGVSALIGQLILPRLSYRGGSLILAAVVGVVVLRLVALIPVVGSIVMLVAALVGFGAAVLAVWDWQRHRRERRPDVGEVEPRQAA